MKRALCIGVSDYNSLAPDLPGVANDVNEIATLLAGDDGSFGSNLSIVLDSEATKSRIVEEIEAIFVADQNDELLVYMAGHGTEDNEHYYFVPFGSQAGHVEEWAFPLTQLKTLFDSSKAKRILVFLDFCHSGGIVPRSASSATKDMTEVLSRDITITGGTGKMIYAACTEHQSSYEHPIDEYGYFTKAVAEGLRGAAANANGEITPNLLFDFVSEQLEILKLAQMPMQHGSMSGRMILRHSSSRSPSANLDVQSPVIAAQELLVNDSDTVCMVGEFFFETSGITRTNQDITLDIKSIDSELSTELDRLRKHAGINAPIPFAHLATAQYVYVVDVTINHQRGLQSCSIKLREAGWQGGQGIGTAYSVDGRNYGPLDLAVIGAEKVLLGKDPGEEHVPGRGRVSSVLPISGLLRIDYVEFNNTCPLIELHNKYAADPIMWLKAARLRCVYILKKYGISDDVQRLEFIHSDRGTISVSFKGKMTRTFQNVEPEEFEVNGECSF